MEGEDDLFGERQRGGRAQEGRVSHDTRLRLHSAIAHIQQSLLQICMPDQQMVCRSLPSCKRQAWHLQGTSDLYLSYNSESGEQVILGYIF